MKIELYFKLDNESIAIINHELNQGCNLTSIDSLPYKHEILLKENYGFFQRNEKLFKELINYED